MTEVIGNNDRLSGRCESYRIGSHRHVLRATAVRKVKQGKVSGAHVVTVNGQGNVPDNSEGYKKDNANRDM